MRALSSAWRSGVQLYDPSLWQAKYPEIEESMMRDATIRAALSKRFHMVAATDWSIQPRDPGSPVADLAVAVATELLKRARGNTQARLNLARACLSGSRYMRVHGAIEQVNIDGGLRSWWVPKSFEDIDKRSFRKVAERSSEGDLTAHWEQWHVGRGQWEPLTCDRLDSLAMHVYQDDESTFGYGRGLREALAWWWYAKEHVFVESLAAVERFAQGVVTASVVGSGTAAIAAASAAR